MFKLQRQNYSKPTKSRERIDFKFSNFQALQVPKGWDRLFVSLISVETGKTVAKLGKALVQNGTCQWTETVLESIWLSRNDPSREYEECLFKLALSMGSVRSGNLGEATINMARYTSSKVSAAVSQPLKNCNHGTVLQFKIHCLTPRTKTRDDESRYSNASEKDMGSKSNESDKSSDSIFGHQDMGTPSYPVKSDSKETNHSASGSNRRFDSAEGSIAKENSFSRGEKHSSQGRQVGSSVENSPSPDDNFLDDCSPSNQSSFNSRQHLRADIHNEAEAVRLSFTDANTSRDLLVAAEDTIDEIRAEAKMWERNARKLMLDLDLSRKEYTDQSKKQAELEIKLSLSYAECDSLRRDREELKLLLEESTMKQATLAADSTTKPESHIQIQKELENEIKYQQESNANLAQQLKRNQESNIELVSLLQELEETIEKQKVEIENLSSLKFDFKEMESSIAINSQDNNNLLLQLQQLQDSEKTLLVNVQLLEKALRDKTDDIENERNSNCQYLLHAEKDYKNKLSIKEEEIARLEEKLSNFIPRGQWEDMDHSFENYKNLIGEIEALKEKVQELEKDCAELTDENLDLVLKLKESDKNSIRNCGSYSDESEVIDPKCQTSQLEEELEKKVSEEVQLAGFETSKHFTDIMEQLEVAFHHLNKPWYNISSDESVKSDYFLQDLMSTSKGNTTTTKTPAAYIVSFLLELNKKLEQRIAKYAEVLNHCEVEIEQRNIVVSETRENLEDCILKLQKNENLKATVEERYSNLVEELAQKSSQVENLEADLLSKEENINFLLQQQSKLEIQVADLQQTNSHLEENLEIVLKESNATSECLENLKNDLIVLQNSVSSHASAKKMLERQLEELESEKHELQKNLFKLQEENLQLQECTSDLESQISHVKDEKESCQLELDSSKSIAISLQDEIRNFKFEMDTYVSDLQQKCEDMQKHWLEAQAECQNLKTENQKLRASATAVQGESVKLKNSNSELNRENLELQEHCSEMASQLRDSKNSLSDCSKKVESLEDHFASMLEGFSERENKNQKEKLALMESLKQTFLEKKTEFESLQKQVEYLTRQIYEAHKEWERISFETEGEISSLVADKAKLESSLQEALLEAELAKSELEAVQTESQLKVKGFKGELTASQRSYETRMAENEKMLKSLGSYRKSEEKLKTQMNDLELKLTISDYERQQLTKEMASLKVQLVNIPELQDEVSVLKNKLMKCTSAKGKLELTLQTVSRDYEDLKVENISFAERVSKLQKAISDFEECKMEKIALEEKLLQNEGALTKNEILCAENADLRNEISEIKKVNIQYQQKIYQLEEEKDECLEKAQALEEELKLMEEDIQTSGGKGYNGVVGHNENPNAISMENIRCLENELAEALDANNKYKIQVDRLMSMGHNNHAVTSKQSTVSGDVVTRQRYERTKSSLETELRELRERYLQMSLKYAEVETQREDLVMKLKANKGGKRWFS